MVGEDNICHEVEMKFGLRSGERIVQQGEIVRRGKKMSAIVGDAGDEGWETRRIITPVIGHG